MPMMDRKVYKRKVVLHTDLALGIVEILQNSGSSRTLHEISNIQKDFRSLNEALESNQLSKRFVQIANYFFFLKLYLIE